MTTVRAWMRGYLMFTVNGRRFLTFDRAAAEAHMLAGMRLSVTMWGWRPFLGWSVLLIKEHPGPAIYDLTAGRWLQDGDAA